MRLTGRAPGLGTEADAQLVLAATVARSAHGHARGLRAEAHQLALVARARRAARAAEVDRLEQVRLAGAVGAVHDRQALAERGLGARIGAEVAQLHADARARHGHPHTFSRMGMIR